MYFFYLFPDYIYTDTVLTMAWVSEEPALIEAINDMRFTLPLPLILLLISFLQYTLSWFFYYQSYQYTQKLLNNNEILKNRKLLFTQLKYLSMIILLSTVERLFIWPSLKTKLEKKLVAVYTLFEFGIHVTFTYIFSKSTNILALRVWYSINTIYLIVSSIIMATNIILTVLAPISLIKEYYREKK